MGKQAHFIGLCGAGMSAVAALLKDQGYEISGSDEGVYAPVSTYLERLGIPCAVGHSPANLPEDPDLVVIGKHAGLTPEENKEVAAAFERFADRIRSFPEVLRQIGEGRDRIVVAGSYGKSSVTALISWVLKEAGIGPGWFVGAVPRALGRSSSLGEDGPFVLEGDEYPSANWDAQSKFLHYDPHTVVLTSATHDHVNIFPTLKDYHEPFNRLLTDLSERSGRLIACTDESYASGFFGAYAGSKISYGLNPGSDVSAVHIQLGDPDGGAAIRFSLTIEKETYPDFSSPMMGAHTVQNICAAAAALVVPGLVNIETFRDAVARFDGVERRLDRKAPKGALPIYEGFGSSFEKARAAIDAMKAHFAARRLTILFEPHTFTWRNRAALNQYETDFAGADTVWLYAPPETGAASHDQASGQAIFEKTSSHHRDVRRLGGDLTAALEGLSATDDVVLILSSGSFGGGLAPLLEAAERRFPSAPPS